MGLPSPLPGAVPTPSRGRLAQGCALTALPHSTDVGTGLECFSTNNIVSPRH